MVYWPLLLLNSSIIFRVISSGRKYMEVQVGICASEQCGKTASFLCGAREIFAGLLGYFKETKEYQFSLQGNKAYSLQPTVFYYHSFISDCKTQTSNEI